jgi:hypothetical protein
MKYRLLLLSLVFEIPVASASNWVVIERPDNHTEGSMLLDKDSVTFEGDKRTAWFKFLLINAAPAKHPAAPPAPKSDEEDIAQTLAGLDKPAETVTADKTVFHITVDCARRVVAPGASVEYKSNKVISKTPEPASLLFSPPEPGSWQELFLDKLCSYSQWFPWRNR